MNISLNWLKEFVNLPSGMTPEELGEALTMHTVEVEGIEQQSGKFANVVVGKVLEVAKHPNADRLRLAKVDVGKEKLDIVCGAPNLEVGQLVPVALVGAILPNGLEIQAAEVRGEKSNGMICAEDELGLGDNHDGIMVLEKNAKVGKGFADYLKLDDVVLEVDNKSLSNRPDLWGHMGIAREIGAILDTKFTPKKLDNKILKSNNKNKLSIKVEDKKLCPRYMAIAMDGIKIESSPKWLQDRLMAVGQRPINNIVDITNFVMLELGQPMHAFDKNLVEKIVVRNAKKGEILETLDGEKRELDKSMLVIADNKKAIAIAGVMGGTSSEIYNETAAIVLESANFNHVSIRKTSDKLALRTESSMRFEKALDPNLAELGLIRAVELIKEICPDAKVSSELVDEKSFKLDQGPIEFDIDIISKKIGTEIGEKDIVNILKKLGFEVEKNDKKMKVIIPTWRATKDISIIEDIVEEVARVYGFNNLDSAMPNIAMEAPLVFKERIIERKIKDILSLSANLFEVYNYSFVGEEQLKRLKVDYSSHIKLANPIASHQTLLRQSLAPNLIENIKLNQAKYENVEIYEIGNVFLSLPGRINKDDQSNENLPHQEKRIGVAIGSRKKNKSFAKTKGIVELLFNSFNIEINFEEELKEMPGWAASKTTAKIVAQGRTIGLVSLLESKTVKSLGIKKELAIADISFEELTRLISENSAGEYKEIAKYPVMIRDLAFVVNSKILYNEIKKEIENFNDLIIKVELFDVYQGERIGKDKKSLAFNINYQSREKTLSSEEIDKLQKELIKTLEKKFEAKIRDF